jgi:hypothetical protein
MGQQYFFFFETGAKKFCPNQLIKKERIAQLIYGKPGKNRYKHTNHESTTTYQGNPTNSPTHLNYHPLEQHN